ncbi:MAG: hypothetical protein D6698_16060 [Gammaproteobacteria bacterium]|nr:MAG: hypothetical protein D6698_16060 [Gammaproteobacteria bacterium]
MRIETFLAHYHIRENPFCAEEARHDPVFDRLLAQDITHPEFAKVLGQVDRPSSSVVFGEKGSGKTAIRLMIDRHVAKHNAEHPDRLVMVIPYDDLNPMLDRLVQAHHGNLEEALNELRLADHQDTILSLSISRFNDALLGEQPVDPAAQTQPAHSPRELVKKVRKLPKQSRINLAVLSALYDQPRTGSILNRWRRVRRRLGLGWLPAVPWIWLTTIVACLIAAGCGIAYLIQGNASPQAPWLLLGLGLAVAAALIGVLVGAWGALQRYLLAKRVAADMPAIGRTFSQLSDLFQELGPRHLAGQPLPIVHSNDADDCRYQLTNRFLEAIAPLGYTGLIVLVDRVDEPTVVHGRADRMRSIIWPMLDNKFLQQQGIGIKLLLPIELRHMVHRESPAFFEEARLDKQHMIDRLTWSGATLYDICTARLQACLDSETEIPPVQLMDLFAEDVTRDAVIDALDQMQQPRDAFKFLYNLILEHCRLNPEDTPNFKIARITLDNVRRAHAQKVQDRLRGLGPA